MSRRLFASMVAVVGIGNTAVATPPNVPVSGALPNLQNEEQVWICPTDPTIFYANHRDFRLGYRQIGMARSTNSGLTWTDSLMSPAFQLFDWQSDPVLTATSSGRLVHCYLDFKSSSPNYDSSFMAFLVSDDCGLTWQGPYTTLPIHGPWFEDKQFLTSDRSGSAYDGNLYVSWTRFSDVGGFDPTRILVCRSTNGGSIWDDTVIVGHPFSSSCFGAVSAGQFSQPVVGKDGALYVFWQGYDIDSTSGCLSFDALRFNKSTDGGQTWEGERILNHVSGWSNTSSGIDVYSQPVTDADLSTGPHSGNLYLQYRDTTSAPHDVGSILFRRSLDTGHTWSAPILVNDDPPANTAEQFHNWMVVNEYGVIAAVWYDTRLDPNREFFDVFAAYSFDGGASWTSNERISNVSSSPYIITSTQSTLPSTNPQSRMSPDSPQTPMAGRFAEYIGLAVNRSTLVTVWTDTRTGSQDVWSATWELHLTVPRLLTADGDTVGCNDSLSWATAWLEDEDAYDIEFVDDTLLPGIVMTQVSTIPRLPHAMVQIPGNWYWRVRAHNAPGGTVVETTPWCGYRRVHVATSCTQCMCDCHADPVCDAVISNVQDVVATINVAFRGAAAIPDPNGACPYETTDTNCDSVTSVIDVVKVVNVAFRGSNPATEFCAPCP